MPKAPATPASPREGRRHNPLAEDYAPTGPAKHKSNSKRKNAAGTNEQETTIDSKASRRILEIGQELIDQDSQERDDHKAHHEPHANPAFTFDSRVVAGQPTQNSEFPDDIDNYDEEPWIDEEDEDEHVEDIDPSDQDIFNRFNPSSSSYDPVLDPNNLSFDKPKQDVNQSISQRQQQQQGTNLADLILEKIALHEAAQSADPNDPHPHPQAPSLDDFEAPESAPLPEKAITVYTTIGQLLSRQRSGPLPKPFKILPSLPPEQIVPLLDLTNPSQWTPHVHLMSTRLFISSKPSIAQPYLTTILLPRIRDDIHETKKLHVHLYQALKKALYKPACFFKGLLFPLLEGGTATQREATIIASVISRVSVPVLHSAAALLRLCDIAAEQFSTRPEGMEAAGPTNIVIRCLLEKKYALPYKVVDALVFHFLRFKALDPAAVSAEERGGYAGADTMMNDGPSSRDAAATGAYKLTVLWHQSLLTFAQRYRNDITEDQREALLDLVAARGHREIGPEVRRELLAGRGRGIPLQGTDGMQMDIEAEGGDDTMAPISMSVPAVK